MEAALDNPIWHALNTGNLHLAQGNSHTRYFDPSVGLFAGMPGFTRQDFQHLYEILPGDRAAILFTPTPVFIPEEWTIHLARPLLQMVYKGKYPAAEPAEDIRLLGTEHVSMMIALTTLTRPGPFFQRTIEFGRFEGIFSGEELVAISGQRLQPDPFTEITTVCVHPDHHGKGYAKKLVRNQIRHIMDAQRIPFLHLYADNEPALALYKSMQFETSREMMVYLIRKSL